MQFEYGWREHEKSSGNAAVMKSGLRSGAWNDAAAKEATKLVCAGLALALLALALRIASVW
jgi:hypothetical protein